MNNALGYNFHMSRWSGPIFLTFVLCAIFATSPAVYGAPTPTSPSLDDVAPAQDDQENPDQELKSQTLVITPAPPGPTSAAREAGYFYPYRQALTLRLGQTQSSFAGIDDSKGWVVGGVQYLFTSNPSTYYEAGADLNSEGSGALHLQRRWIFSSAKFRPYTKAGGGVRVVPSESLVSFLRLQNWQARGAAGFERIVWRKMSLRAEIEAAVSQNGYWLIGTIGIVWPW